MKENLPIVYTMSEEELTQHNKWIISSFLRSYAESFVDANKDDKNDLVVFTYDFLIELANEVEDVNGG